MLKLKARIFWYFGIFLADREENDYLQSKEFWESFFKIYSDPDNDMDVQDIQGLLLGLWEANYGFARPMSVLRCKHPRVIFSVIAWFVDFFTVIKCDIRDFTRKISEK
jgi:hypothetical protein